MRSSRGYKRRRTGGVYVKHLLALQNYWTPRKLWNMVLCEIEKRRRVPLPRSVPYTATIDVTNACNLRCPGCPTGAGIEGRPKTMLDLTRLERFLDEMGDYLIIANLYNWGETLLHPQAAEFVRRVHARRIFTSISSNLSVQPFDRIEAVCDAGLDHLLISADGATPESYRRYRVGGNFGLVVDNIRRIVAYRRKRRKRRPILEWQILAFNYLEPELEQAAELAHELGVDWFSVKGPTAPAELQSQSEDLRGAFYGGADFCALLWHNVVLQADGGIAPCCNVYHKEDDFGHLDEATLRLTLANARYRTARQLFDPARASSLERDLDHPCLRCPIVHRQKHLSAYLASNPRAYTRADFMSVIADRSEEERTWVGL